MKTISIPVNDRPDLLQRCLASIKACSGWTNWFLVFSCEPSAQHFIEKFRFYLPKVFVSVNTTRMGCRVNTFLAAQAADACGSDFNLYLEDDIVLSKDALTLADQFREGRKGGLLCLRRWHVSQNEHQPDIVAPAPHGLLGNGFAYDRAMWPLLRKYWFYDTPEAGGKMWDWTVSLGLDNECIPQWRPMINRSKSIGTKGTHTAGGGDLNHFGELYQGDPIQRFIFTP